MQLRNPAKHISLTLRGKIVAWVLFSTVGAMLVLTMENIASTREREQAHAFAALQAEADRYAQDIQTVFTRMEADAALLAGVPDMQRFEQLSFETAPPDGSKTEARHRVEGFFGYLMETRPYYRHVRLIGRTDAWRELARLNREASGVQIVAATDLQQTRAPPAFAVDGKAPLDQSTSWQISRSRAQGRGMAPSTLRIIRPLFVGKNTVSAVLEIEADLSALLHVSSPKVAKAVRATVVTGTGDYMMFERGIDAPPMVYHEDENWRASAATEALDAALAGRPERFVRDHAAVVRAIRPARDSPALFFLVTTMAQSDLYAMVNADLRAHASLSFLIAMLVFLVTGTGSLLAASQLTRPLRETLSLVKTSRDAPEPLRLETQANDEIGELADAFLTQTNALLPAAVRARAVFESAGHAIVVCTDDGRIEEANNAAATLFGYEAKDMIGLRAERLLEQGELSGRSCFGDLDGTGHGAQDMTGRRRSGELLHLAVSATHARFAEANHLILIMQDVTEARRAEERVQKLVARLERSNEELDQFAYITSHDLKAPLRVIANAAGWLAEDLEEHLTDDTRDTLGLIESRVHRMGRLLEAMLEHSRIGRVQVAREWTHFGTMMQDIEALLEEHDGFDIIVQPDLMARPVIRLPLQSVLLNLISNAIRHHDRPRGTIHVGCRDLGDRVEFSVSDDGPGIPTSFQEKVFQPFQTLKPRDRVDTAGIGLAMVRKQVALVGGEIRLVSDGERGTAFFVLWPNPKQDAAPETACDMALGAA
ncbi:sensor histidine kinase [Pacificoceanicola onchidii]|uniref:sensor histidine kinase n=1 Tax=Pacificoceanicola onchidii TaxID=2562685 RepID=UPI0010A36556|nr:ATP-binding protein [Pacificoceanicola onchidii]